MKKNNLSLAWIVWGIASLFYAYQYILRVLPNILMEPLMTTFSIQAQDMGQFSGLYYYLGYAGFHLPLGVLLDRWGVKKTMVLCLLLIIGGTLPILYSSQWWLVLSGRMIVGVGSSAAILSAFQLIYQGFDERHFSRMLGGCVTIGLLGAMYGGQPLQQLVMLQGWQSALQIVLLFGIILIISILLFVPTIPLQNHQGSIMKELKEIIKNPNVLKICFFAGYMVGPMEGFADVWAKMYLEKMYGFSVDQATFLPSLIFLGMCLGAPFLGIIAEKTVEYYKMLSLAGLIMGSIFLFILLGYGTEKVLAISLVVVGFFSAYQILAIYKATTLVEKKQMGMTTSLANMIIMVFGYIFHKGISSMIHHYWDGTLILSAEGKGMIPCYSTVACQAGLAIIPIGLLIGSIGFWWCARKEKTFLSLKRN